MLTTTLHFSVMAVILNIFGKTIYKQLHQIQCHAGIIARLKDCYLSVESESFFKSAVLITGMWLWKRNLMGEEAVVYFADGVFQEVLTLRKGSRLRNG